MEVRKYKSEDFETVAELFFNTVHRVNAKDYSKEQLDVWATGHIDKTTWNNSLLMHNTLIAEEEGNIVGFGDMDEKGFLDRLFVHKDHQRKGVATVIVTELEKDALHLGISSFTTHASITAKPFFEKMGYRVVRENIAIRSNIELMNYIMEKIIAK